MSYTVIPLGRTFQNGGPVVTQQPLEYPQIVSIPDAYATAVVPYGPRAEAPQYPKPMPQPAEPNRPIIKEVDTDDRCCKGCCGSDDTDYDLDDADEGCCGGGCCGRQKYADEVDDGACCGGDGGCCGEKGTCCGGDGGMCCGKRGGGCCNDGTEEVISEVRRNEAYVDQPEWEPSQQVIQERTQQFPQTYVTQMYRPAVSYVPTRRLVPVSYRQQQMVSPITLTYPQKPVRVVSLAPQTSSVYPFQSAVNVTPRVVRY